MLRLRLLQLLVRVAARTPVSVLYAVSGLMATLTWYASGSIRSVTRDHMRHVFPTATPPRTIDRAARGATRSAGYYYVDFARYAHLEPGDAFDHVDSIDGVEQLFEAYDRGRGVILASAHLGDPEFIGQALAPFFDIAVLTERLEPPALHDFVHKIRGRSGVQFVPADRGGLRTTLKQLRCGGVLGMLIDRDVLGTGEPFPFFRERAPMPRGAVELAWATGAAIVLGFVVRSGAGRYRITLRTVEAPTRENGSGDRAADLEAGMRLVVAALESGIRATPDQWFVLSPIWTSGLTESRTPTS
jgi:KDO2-lipid IV(A) lauroyltransferase